jgi:hypothetical protein
MTDDPAMMSSTIPVQQPRQAPPVGRVLRILLGFVLMIYVTPCLLPRPGAGCRGGIVADARVNRRL